LTKLANTEIATVVVRIYGDGFMLQDGLLVPAYVELPAKVLEESATTFVVEFDADLVAEHPEFGGRQPIEKADKSIRVTYSSFVETTDLPLAGPATKAIYKIGVMFAVEKIGFGFKTMATDVLIVAETETHYQLRFTPDFASENPNLCSQWVAKDSKDPEVIPQAIGA
jgi:hypothetical protein